MASPTSAISSPTPLAASEIRTCASAAEYCALMTSFLVRNGSILERSFCSFSISDCCCASSSATCWSSDWSSVCANCLRSSAVRARSSLPGGERLARLRVELDDLLLELLLLQLEALLRRDDVGDALLDVLQQLHLLLVAVLERLRGILRPVEQLEIFALMTVDMRPPMPGTASSLMQFGSWSKRTVRRWRGRLAAAPSPVWIGVRGRSGWRALEAARRARGRAPARAVLERGASDLAGGAEAVDARVEPQAGDDHVRVAAVRVDRDPRRRGRARPSS